MHTGAVHRFLPAVIAIAAIGCASQSAPPTDDFGAYNTAGGSDRANNYSKAQTNSINVLTTVTFKGLRGSMLAPPLPLFDNRTLVLSTGGIVSMTLGDSLVWSDTLGVVVPGLAIDSSGLIYAAAIGSQASGATVHALTLDGKKAWSATLPPYGSGPDTSAVLSLSFPLAIHDGVVIGSNVGRIDRLDHAGKHVWSVQRGGSFSRTIAAGPGVGIVAAVTHNDYATSDTIIALDPLSGVERWSAATEGVRIIEGPAIVGDLIVVGAAQRDSNGGRNPMAIAFSFDGKERWRTPLIVMPRGISGDGGGNIYISGTGARRDFSGGAVVSLDHAGKSRWRVVLETDVPSSPAVSSAWVYFVSQQDGRTGLFSYSLEGTFGAFVPISTIPDVIPLPVITSVGQVLLAGLDEPVIIEGRD